MGIQGIRLSDQKRSRIIKLLQWGMSLTQVAKSVSVSRSSVERVKETAKEIGIVKPRKPEQPENQQ